MPVSQILYKYQGPHSSHSSTKVKSVGSDLFCKSSYFIHPGSLLVGSRCSRSIVFKASTLSGNPIKWATKRSVDIFLFVIGQSAKSLLTNYLFNSDELNSDGFNSDNLCLFDERSPYSEKYIQSLQYSYEQ